MTYKSYDPNIKGPLSGPHPPLWTDKYAAWKAEQLGKVIRYGKPNEFLIDVDSNAALAEFWERFDFLVRIGLLSSNTDELRTKVEVLPSTTVGHYHVVVTLIDEEMFDVQTRILYQALLGSDWQREALSLRGWEGGEQDRPILFYRPKEEEV